MKDIKLTPKSGENYGNGNLDFEIREGHLIFVEDKDMIVQAVIKLTISKLQPKTGYGVSVRDFRGTKEIVPLRTGITVRLLRGLSLLERWYGKKIDIEAMDIDLDPVSSNFTISLRVYDKMIRV